eukprot:maker-scaffold446_size168061-snap-gene-0.26 protein:Tk08584 transcript:maker-scaffold446_size168061-snap-gene-0.26-mRNA-1 annotation:"hypothetical protein LOTGIDRAFT_103997"
MSPPPPTSVKSWRRNGGTYPDRANEAGLNLTPSFRNNRPCRTCGQVHSHHEPHLYNYSDEVDEDLMCQICLQPFVQPVDTPCAHTFCHVCILNYLKVNPLCPLDRKPLTEMTVNPTNLVLKRLLDKLEVTCPNSDSCQEGVSRGSLSDHLRYRCLGTLVACQFASAGCDYRGPTKSMNKHQNECQFKKQGITRLPILEGEVSHIEIPRTRPSLGMTIVGGADTPLRCVVVQEIYQDGLLAQDGRLRPGDQIIEINGMDMTRAKHGQVCACLRKMGSVLRLGIYRERIEKYSMEVSKRSRATVVDVPRSEELLTITLERETSKQLGIRLSGKCSMPGIYIVDIQEGSTASMDGRIQRFDRLMFINGQDVRHCGLVQATALIQNNDKVSLVVGRSPDIHLYLKDLDDPDGGDQLSTCSSKEFNHSRSKSAPAIHHPQDDCDEHTLPDGAHIMVESDGYDSDHSDTGIHKEDISSASKPYQFHKHQESQPSKACLALQEEEQRKDDHIPWDSDDRPQIQNDDDYMAIYETLDRALSRKEQLKDMKKAKSQSMEALETPTASIKSFEFPPNLPQSTSSPPSKDHRGRNGCSVGKGEDMKSVSSRSADSGCSSAKPGQKQTLPSDSGSSSSRCHDQKDISSEVRGGTRPLVPSVMSKNSNLDSIGNSSMSLFLRRALRLQEHTLQERLVKISKNARESLGMRIGGGVGSNEGDTPIYVANIHPHGCIGKSKLLKKGDVLLSVDTTSLFGLTHAQAVMALKATINRSQVTLGVMDGPETSFGASNFIPSWMYWQKLPRSLQYPKTVILHRKESRSWGFSIVGGAKDDQTFEIEPIHVLFVVPGSPAAKDAKIKCGDRLLAVDGTSLDNIDHSVAVAKLKQTSTRVVLEVVSWLGTEL